jgi:hypothetical protein
VTEIMASVFNTINPGNAVLNIPIKILENFIWIIRITVDSNQYETKLNHIFLQVGFSPFISGSGMRVLIAFTSRFLNSFPRSGIHIPRTKLHLHHKVDATVMHAEMTVFILLCTSKMLCLNSTAEIFFGP